RHAELLNRRAVLAGQLCERVWTVLGHAEIEEVVRLFVPSHIPPQIGIDDPNRQLVTEMIEERLQLLREDIDRARHDVTVRAGPPGKHRPRRDEEEQDGGPEESQHAGIVAAWTTSRRRLAAIVLTLLAADVGLRAAAHRHASRPSSRFTALV